MQSTFYENQQSKQMAAGFKSKILELILWIFFSCAKQQEKHLNLCTECSFNAAYMK